MCLIHQLQAAISVTECGNEILRDIPGNDDVVAKREQQIRNMRSRLLIECYRWMLTARRDDVFQSHRLFSFENLPRS